MLVYNVDSPYLTSISPGIFWFCGDMETNPIPPSRSLLSGVKILMRITHGKGSGPPSNGILARRTDWTLPSFFGVFGTVPPQWIRDRLTLFAKSFSPFPRGTYRILAVSCRYLALEEIYPPYSSCTLKQLYSLRRSFHQLYCPFFHPFKGLSPSIVPEFHWIQWRGFYNFRPFNPSDYNSPQNL